MLIEMLNNWAGAVEVNGTCYDSVKDLPKSIIEGFSKQIDIKLHPKTENVIQSKKETISGLYKITVKSYMTKRSTPEFDFMSKWNNNTPMPLRTMTGTKLKETKGMVYMQLHGQADAICTCMRCNKQLTNPISQHYGIGPECMSKLGIVADINDIDTIKKKLVDVVWEGWIIKSAILKEEQL